MIALIAIVNFILPARAFRSLLLALFGRWWLPERPARVVPVGTSLPPRAQAARAGEGA